ncbi:hypothetical protein Hypma_001626 [Hypsizygus marmoreus]|uniref:Uncharacterized protein n=1 Tax=Hypsizygus marmoreus TaxID=39966 RepID=A0A369J5X3_HYPMA|nr:hypothetical protein Hypma_001626 [Hypsizygus marmoreus]
MFPTTTLDTLYELLDGGPIATDLSMRTLSHADPFSPKRDGTQGDLYLQFASSRYQSYPGSPQSGREFDDIVEKG